MATIQIIEYTRVRGTIGQIIRVTDVTSSGSAASHTLNSAADAVKSKALDGDIRFRLDGTATDGSGSVFVAFGDSESFDLVGRETLPTISYIDAA